MVLSLFAAGLLMNNVARAQEKFILSSTEFTVKGGHESQFEERVKAWKACYFAALDVKRDAVWEMVEKAKGKEETEKMRAKFRSSVKDSWMYLYKRMDDLSHNPVQ